MKHQVEVNLIDADGDYLLPVSRDFDNKAQAREWIKEARTDRQRWVQHAESESWADSIVLFVIEVDGIRREEYAPTWPSNPTADNPP